MFQQIRQPIIIRQLSALRNPKSSSAAFPCRCPPEVYSVHAKRDYSYYKSKTEESPDKYTQYDKSFKEWKFVEKLMPNTHVPAPPSGLDVLPSGWRPPNPPADTTYIIRRTKNHLVPVYVKVEARGEVRHTYIGKVEGNIWQLETDIGRYLQQTLRPPIKPIILRTNEISRQVIIKGDHVDLVKQWVIDQGY